MGGKVASCSFFCLLLKKVGGDNAKNRSLLILF